MNIKKLFNQIVSKLTEKKRTSQFLEKVFTTKIVSDEVLFEGSKLCYLNAKDLFELAKIAFDNKKYAHSVSLSVLAAEELSKMETMLSLSINKKTNFFEWWYFWKIFSGEGHKIKLRSFHALKLSFGSNNIEEMSENYLKSAGLAGQADNDKKSGFYVGFDKGRGKFTKAKSSSKHAKTWLDRVENALATDSHFVTFSLDDWMRLVSMMRLRIPDNIDMKISDAVYHYRKKVDKK